jgi:cysteine protease ATG4
VQSHPGNTQESGSDHRQLPDVYSELFNRVYGLILRADRLLSAQGESPNLRVYVTSDTSDVYEDKFTQVARDQTGRMQPTLILLGIRLGIDHITPVYWDGLRAALQYPQSVGIAG